jgi:hypothetical protein
MEEDDRFAAIRNDRKTAGRLIIFAKESAKRAHAMRGRIGEHYEVMATVVLCAVVAEAGINEIADWYDSFRETPPFSINVQLPPDFKDKDARHKWRTFPLLIGSKTFEESEEPWRSFDALIDLRNRIVHLTGDTLKPKSAAFFRERNLPVDFLKFPVAEWACHTIATMFDELTKLVAPPERWIDQVWLWTPTHSFPYGLSTPGDPWPSDQEEALPKGSR